MYADETSREPIPTCYKGYMMRSRTEPRWAVLFDHYRLAWQYEPDGYDLPVSGWYLVDFWLFAWQCFVETKGPRVPDRFLKCRELRDKTRQPVILALKAPSYETVHLFCYHVTDAGIDPYTCPAIFCVRKDGFEELALIPQCDKSTRLVTPEGRPMNFLTTLNGARSAPLGGYLASRSEQFPPAPSKQLSLIQTRKDA